MAANNKIFAWVSALLPYYFDGRSSGDTEPSTIDNKNVDIVKDNRKKANVDPNLHYTLWIKSPSAHCNENRHYDNLKKSNYQAVLDITPLLSPSWGCSSALTSPSSAFDRDCEREDGNPRPWKISLDSNLVFRPNRDRGEWLLSLVIVIERLVFALEVVGEGVACVGSIFCRFLSLT